MKNILKVRNEAPKRDIAATIKRLFRDKNIRYATILFAAAILLFAASFALPKSADGTRDIVSDVIPKATVDAVETDEFVSSPAPIIYSPAPKAAKDAMKDMSATLLLATAPPDDAFVRVQDYMPDVIVDLKYSTDDNFTGKVIYDFSDAYLRFGTVKKLMAVQEELEKDGLTLVIWDAFRPVSAQYTLYTVTPNANYVANPYRGYSTHSRGNTVDVTIADENGTPVEMPSSFDDFSARADRQYSDVSKAGADNAGYLTDLMTSNGFTTISSEWWHFADGKSYPVATTFEPSALTTEED